MKHFSNLILVGLSICWSGCEEQSSSKAGPVPAFEGNPVLTEGEIPIVSIPLPSLEQKPATGLGLVDGLQITRAEYLKNVGAGIAQQAVDFRNQALNLQAAVESYCSQPQPESLLEAQQKFRDAILSWEQLELFQVGPIAAEVKSLKYQIYGWPQVSNTCKIDEESLKAAKDSGYELPSFINRKGLQAFEYLLFESSLAASCPRSNPTTAVWNELDSKAKWSARCSYMKFLGVDLVKQAKTLESAWGTAENNYFTSLVGSESAEQGGLQSVFENLFYFDLEVKNLKVAAPAGQDKRFCNKSPAPCLDKEELRWSQLSREALDANFMAFANLMNGFALGSDPRKGGFTALVRSNGSPELAASSEAKLQLLGQLHEQNQESLPALITAKAQGDCDVARAGWLCLLRNSIKNLTSDLKNEYSQILKVEVPAAPQGDND